MSKVASVIFVSLAAWQVHRLRPLWCESQRSHRGDEVERRLREGCQGIVAQHFSQHTYNSQQPPLLLPGLGCYGTGMCVHACVCVCVWSTNHIGRPASQCEPVLTFGATLSHTQGDWAAAESGM